MAEITLQMPDEDLATMLPALKEYIAVPFTVDAEGKPTDEVIDDLSYIKHLCVSHIERCFTKGTIIQANAAAKAAIDKAKIEAIKAANLKEKE